MNTISKSLKTDIDFSKVPSPCFLMDMRLLRQNLEIINRVQNEADVKIILALKGFSMFSTFNLIKEYLPGTTASSLHEARLGFEEFGGEVHVYSPAYYEHEWDELTFYCNHISFNSISQYNKFYNQKSNSKVSYGLRINPEYSEVEVDMYNPCIPGSRLGIFKEHLGVTLPEGIEGLHFHNLCESSSYALENTLKSVEEKFGKYLPHIKWINMGGGHLMTRHDYNVEHLIETLKKFKAKYPHLQVYLEPGSAIAWQTGYLVSKVQDVVESRGVEVAILDISIAAHMPDCLEMPYKPAILNASQPIAGKPTYRFGGGTCLAGDFIGDYSFDEKLDVGNIVVFDDMMHYTMVKTTTFNGVNLPNIGLWNEDGSYQHIKSFGYNSFLDKLS